MKFKFICNVVLLLSTRIAIGLAGEGSPCSEPAARAFDFWIGNWDISQQILRQDGTWLVLPAHTSVTATLDGCALIEHWSGQVLFFWDGMTKPDTMKGLSVRAYDPAKSSWYIYWMDTRSTRFGSPYVGSFKDGRGEFFREWESPDGKRKGRITFVDVTTDSVNWELAVSSDDGTTWQTLWKMRMNRAQKGEY